MKATRSRAVTGRASDRGVAGERGAGLLRLQALAQDHVALQRRQVVDEENAVEVVHLMLDAGGQQALGVHLPDSVLAVEEAHADLRRPPRSEARRVGKEWVSTCRTR